MTAQKIKIHRIHNLCFACLGILLNLLLIYVVIKKTKKNFRLYARLVLFSAIFEILYSFFEILCEHQLEIKNGYFFIFSYGIEQYMSREAIGIIGVAHLSLYLMNVTIIPTQFRYRFWLVNRENPTLWRLMGSVLISFSASTFLAILALFAHYKCHERGDAFYTNMLDPMWQDGNGKTKFIDAIDLQDTITKFYYAFGTLIIIGSYSIALFYGYKSIRVVQPLADINKSKTVALRKQFTKNLIIQAVLAYCCSVTPTTWVATTSILKLDMTGYGVWVYTIMSWIPTLNASLTLYIIQPYREFFLELCGKSIKQQSAISTVTRTENLSAISSGQQPETSVRTEQ